LAKLALSYEVVTYEGEQTAWTPRFKRVHIFVTGSAFLILNVVIFVRTGA